jgi:AraC family transcriptional regulator, alkane utilization regulator
MIKAPRVLPETPQIASDLLSDLLGSMHLAGMVLFRAQFFEPWLVDTPSCQRLARMLPFRTEHILPFHIIASGRCWLELPGAERLWLDEGDAVLIPYGDMHRLGGREPATAVDIGGMLPRPPWRDVPVVEHGGSGAETSIICGFLQCDELLFHPILRDLPPLLHVDRNGRAGNGWLSTTIRHTADEASSQRPGARSMLSRLVEVMFVEILRKHMQSLSADSVGWFAALNDPVAGTALRYLHAAPFQDWTVDDLARASGTSKTVLTDRFKYCLKQPPMKYLASWRMQFAAQRLKTSDLPVKAVAEESHYESEAAFSRAFKRHFGSSPADWRRRQAER